MIGDAAGFGEHEILLVLHAAFSAASKGAARRLRDAAIPDPAQLDADERLAVTLKWPGREVWQTRRDGEWRDLCFRRDQGG